MEPKKHHSNYQFPKLKTSYKSGKHPKIIKKALVSRSPVPHFPHLNFDSTKKSLLKNSTQPRSTKDSPRFQSISPIPLKNHPLVLQSHKNDFELELSTDHYILKSLLENEKANLALRDISSMSYNFQRLSAEMKLLEDPNNISQQKKKLENMHNSLDFNYNISEGNTSATEKCLRIHHVL